MSYSDLSESSSTIPTTSYDLDETIVVKEEQEQEQQEQNEDTNDFLGDSSAAQTEEQQNFETLPPLTSSNDALFDTNFQEEEEEQEGNGNEELRNSDENQTSVDEFQWNSEATTKTSSDDLVRNFPRTPDEVLNSSSVIDEYPKVAERNARVQAINQRLADELAARDEAEARRKKDLSDQAKQDLQRWYQERERQMNEKRQQMKNEEDTLRTLSLEKSDESKCDWAKLIRLLEFTPGTYTTKSKRDLSRMKTSIINAKRHADAKNASN